MSAVGCGGGGIGGGDGGPEPWVEGWVPGKAEDSVLSVEIFPSNGARSGPAYSTE